MRCNSCEIIVINGIRCHETGCPDAVDEVRECRECGTEFNPEHPSGRFCSVDCHEIYHGIYRGFTRECEECGDEFEPQYRNQIFCSDSCADPDEEDEDGE